MIQRHPYEIDDGQSVLFCMLGMHADARAGRRPHVTEGDLRHIVGVATVVGLHTDCPNIVAAHVETSRRCQGIGGALIRHCIEEARRRGRPAVYVVVEQANTRAASLYRRIGFEQIDGVRSFTGPTRLVFIYRLADRLEQPIDIDTEAPLTPAFHLGAQPTG